LQASREVGLEVITEKSKYVVASCHQNVGQNRNTNKSLKVWESSSTWKQQIQIKIAFGKKLEAD